MFLIVIHHYVVNSGLTQADGPIYSDPLSWRSLFLLLMGAWGKTGINCFVMITGYFMCRSQITAKKFAKLLCEVVFYRIVIQSVFMLTGYRSFSLVTVAKMLLPVTSIEHNFSSCFIVFYLLIPFLNVLVQHLNERQHIRLLLLCSFSCILLGTLPGMNVTFNYVTWFSVLYLIASYIRLHPKKIFDSTVFWGWMTVAFMGISALSVVTCAWIGTKIDRQMAYYFVTDSNTFLAVATGVSAFMLFKNLRIPYSKMINTIAASSFGVLMIHANGDSMRSWLWGDVCGNVAMYDSAWLPLHVIGCAIAVYAVCTLLDQLRIVLIEKPAFRF